MRSNSMKHIPAGPPGIRRDGTPSKSSDTGSRVRVAYKYQDFMLYIQICSAIRTKEYCEFWTEHHEDFIGVSHQGDLDAFQVKTRENEGNTWKISDQDLPDILRKFLQLGARNSIRHYYICSNVGPYIPTETVDSKAARPKSIYVLQDQICKSLNERLPAESESVIEEMAAKIGCESAEVKELLTKVSFIGGPPLSRLTTPSTDYLVAADPSLLELSEANIRKLEAQFLTLISQAGDGQACTLSSHSAPILGNGRTIAEIYSKRLLVSDFQKAIGSLIKRRTTLRYAGGISVALAILVLAKLMAPALGRSPLQAAMETFQLAKTGPLPSDFAAAVSIIRSSHQSLMDADMQGATLACQDLSSLDLRRLDGRFAHATGIILDNSNLGGAIMVDAELNTASFRDAKLVGTRFTNANMVGTVLTRADARHADFTTTTLQAATLSLSDFSNSSLSGADLLLADLENAIFLNADLEKANLADANISGANFRGAKKLSQEALQKACAQADNPPILDSDLRAPTRQCFTSEHEKDERYIKQAVTGFVAANTVIGGYCLKGRIEYRPPDSTLHPEDNVPVFIRRDQ